MITPKSSQNFDSPDKFLANQLCSVRKSSIKKRAIPCTCDIPYFYNNPPANPPKALYHADKQLKFSDVLWWKLEHHSTVR